MPNMKPLCLAEVILSVGGLPNLKLNTVALHYLQDEKVDLPAKKMFEEFESSPEGRRHVRLT